MNLEALNTHVEKDGFRLRGLGFSRVDAFSDVVFGFALTLLVVSLEVPKTYAELHQLLRGFVPFAISFLFLMMIWHAHYKFFRRFHVHDFATIVINGVLLFVVLFYVYPLKFLFTFLVSGILGQWNGFFESYQQLSELMVLFGLGFTSIYILVGALYYNAYRQRGQLDLSPIETILARSYIVESLGVAAIGLLSCLVAFLLPARIVGYAGLVYWLVAFFKRFYTRSVRRSVARQRLWENLPAPDPQTLESV